MDGRRTLTLSELGGPWRGPEHGKGLIGAIHRTTPAAQAELKAGTVGNGKTGLTHTTQDDGAFGSAV